MTTTKHTPGPWKTDKAGVNVIDPKEKSEYVIAFCRGGSVAEVTANARLIAAAPELARIVDAFVEHANAGNIVAGHNGAHREEITQLVRDARAAIAKATGDAQ